MESPALIFGAVSVSSGVSIAVGIPLIRAFGLSGAVWSIALSETVAFVTAVVFVRRKARQSSQRAAALSPVPATE